VPDPAYLGAPAASEIAVPTIEELGPPVLRLLAQFAAAIAAPVALGGVFALIPTNSSNIHGGVIPGRPDLSYRSDEGVLTISRLDDQGNVKRVYEGFPDSAGLYRDSTGRVFGQHVGTGVVFSLDSLPLFGEPSDGEPKVSPDPTSHIDSVPSSGDPKLCPDPSPENINGRDPDVVRYQSQVTGLPPGQIVSLNGVDFDGCIKENGNMQDAKHGQDWLMAVPEKYRSSLNQYTKTMDQARSQAAAAGERRVIWYFTNPEVASYWLSEFRKAGLENFDTTWEPLKTEKFTKLYELFWEMVA
jgi:hypothetical protein